MEWLVGMSVPGSTATQRLMLGRSGQKRQSAKWLTLRNAEEMGREGKRQRAAFYRRSPDATRESRYACRSLTSSGMPQTVPAFAAISRAAFAPSTCSSVGSDTPFFAAVTSARIDTAISGGVRLPI